MSTACKCFLSSGGTCLSLPQPFTGFLCFSGLRGDASPGWPASLCPDLWCPISLEPAIRAQLKAALFSQQKDISAASWEPATGWTRQGGPSLVVAPVWETLAQPWLGSGGWGLCLPQASQALGPTGGVFFLCPCRAQLTASTTHSSVLGFEDQSLLGSWQRGRPPMRGKDVPCWDLSGARDGINFCCLKTSSLWCSDTQHIHCGSGFSKEI